MGQEAALERQAKRALAYFRERRDDLNKMVPPSHPNPEPANPKVYTVLPREAAWPQQDGPPPLLKLRTQYVWVKPEFGFERQRLVYTYFFWSTPILCTNRRSLDFQKRPVAP